MVTFTRSACSGGLSIALVIAALGSTGLIAGCNDNAATMSATKQIQWEGSLKFVFLERAIVVPFYLTGSEALLLRLSDKTEFIGIGDPVEGEGLHVLNRMFHSEATYRVKGDIAPEEADGVQLLSIPTRILDVTSIELMQKGEGKCLAYLGIALPSRGDRSGWSPMLPDYAERQEGHFRSKRNHALHHHLRWFETNGIVPKQRKC